MPAMPIDANTTSRVYNFVRSAITKEDSANPDAVIAASVPILDWLRAADSKSDLYSRVEALSSAHSGRCNVADAWNRDNVDVFLQEAQTYYGTFVELAHPDSEVTLEQALTARRLPATIDA